MSGRYERIASHTKRKKKENEEKEEHEWGDNATKGQQWIFFFGQDLVVKEQIGGLRFSERKQTDVYTVEVIDMKMCILCVEDKHGSAISSTGRTTECGGEGEGGKREGGIAIFVKKKYAAKTDITKQHRC